MRKYLFIILISFLTSCAIPKHQPQAIFVRVTLIRFENMPSRYAIWLDERGREWSVRVDEDTFSKVGDIMYILVPR